MPEMGQLLIGVSLGHMSTICHWRVAQCAATGDIGQSNFNEKALEKKDFLNEKKKINDTKYLLHFKYKKNTLFKSSYAALFICLRKNTGYFKVHILDIFFLKGIYHDIHS